MNIPIKDLELIAQGLGKDVNRFNGKTILISGSNGFLGKIFATFFQYINKEILFKPCKVICVDNYIVGTSFTEEIEKDKNFQLIRHDICQPLGIKIKKDQKIDFIISAASIAAPSIYLKYPIETLDVGYLGNKNMLDLAYHQEAESILTFSSSEVYGTPTVCPTPETYVGAISTLSDRACYDFSKQMTEVLSGVYFKMGVPVKIAKPFNLYSYVHHSDTRVLPNFIKAILNKQSLKVYGKTTNTRTFCFVTDGITCMLKVLLLGKNGEPYNCGNDKPEINMWDLANLVKKVTEYEGKVELVEYPKNYPSSEPERRCPDLTKAREDLGYEPKVSLEEGILKFYEWAKVNYPY